MQHIRIKGQTMNKKVHATIRQHAPTAETAKKMHVAGCGYVFYIKDKKGATVAQVCKEYTPKDGYFMKVTIK